MYQQLKNENRCLWPILTCKIKLLFSVWVRICVIFSHCSCCSRFWVLFTIIHLLMSFCLHICFDIQRSYSCITKDEHIVMQVNLMAVLIVSKDLFAWNFMLLLLLKSNEFTINRPFKNREHRSVFFNFPTYHVFRLPIETHAKCSLP